jgi:hypothetical protein
MEQEIAKYCGEQNEDSVKHSQEYSERSKKDDSDRRMPLGAIKIPGMDGSKKYITDDDKFESERSHIVSAIPVQELDESEKEKIRIEAGRDVEMRLAQGGEIQIAGVGGYDNSQQQAKKKKIMYILMGVVAAVILIVVVVVVVVTAGGSDKNTNQLQAPSPASPTNTFAPSMAGSTRIPILGRDDCLGAEELDPKTGDLTLLGTTEGAQTDTMIPVCGTVRSNGKGVWYVLEGDDGRWLASTCDNTRFDTQISIYKGSCGRLECVAANDQQCGVGDQSRVAFYADSGSKYYVLVHGHRTQAGNFQLEMATLPDNVNCFDAVEVESFSSATNFGTTAGVTAADATGNVLGDVLGGGVWFRTIFSPFNRYEVHLLEAKNTGFVGEIALLTFADPNGPCDASLIVIGNFADRHDRFETSSDVDEVYFIFVRPKEGELNGDFELSVQANNPAGLIQFDDNKDCDDAAAIFPGFSVASDTRLLIEYMPNTMEIACGNKVFTTSAGYWYQFTYLSFEVSDSPLLPLTFSTCNSQTDFDTQISIFRGNCNRLQCVDGNDQGPSSCGDKSTVSILAESGWTYYVYVHGFGDRGGRYLLTVEEQADLNVGTECGNATEIEPDGISTLGSSENLGAPLTRSCVDSDSEPSAGAWYHLVGTGEAMLASTCHPSTDFGAMISVYAAGEDCSSSLACLEDAVYYPCGVGQTTVSWNTVDQQDYYIFVHEDLPDGLGSGGYFVLSVDTVAENNSCENAIGPLEIRPLGIFVLGVETFFGSTRGSTISDVQGCTDDGGRGLWYSVEGTGSNITVSTCSEYTDFDTQVSVFIGDDCSSLECIGLETLLPVVNLCGLEDTLSWISTLEQRYLILVQGASESDFGNFELQIWDSVVL